MTTGTIWAIVALVLGLAGLTVGLASAGWSPEAITGWSVAIGTLAATLVGVLAKLGGLEHKADTAATAATAAAVATSEQSDVLTEQSADLATIKRRVNGELDERMKLAAESAASSAVRRVADEAAEQASARVIEALRREGVIR